MTQSNRPHDGRSSTRATARYPTNTRSMTSAYMRASVAYRIANGDAASSSTRAHATKRESGACRPAAVRAFVEPPSRVPGRDQRQDAEQPESARTASLPVPNTSIQMCSST